MYDWNMGRAATLMASLCMASCVSSSSNFCEDGSICPGGFVCDVANARCLLPEQIAQCQNHAEAEACTLDSAPGACRQGACIPFFCGDGYVSAGEDCEGDDLQGKDCKDFGFYDVGGLTCTSSCTFDLGAEGDLAVPDDSTGCYAHDYCGDLRVNGPELCDGPQDRTCVSIGFDAGTTSCNLQCGFSIGDCSRFGWNPESLTDVIAFAISGTAHDDQWAFGRGGGAMRFEGAFWNTVPTGVNNDLVNAWSFAPNDAWAVGLSRPSGPMPVVIHWDGSTWTTVNDVPAGEYLDVWGPSASEVYIAASTGIHKYNGTTWSTLPALSAIPKTIRGTSGSDIWVTTTGGPLMHFNGTAWVDMTPSIPATATTAVLQFLDANATDDVWAIGFQSGNGNQGNGVIAHYSGSNTWQIWRAAGNTYNAVAASAPSDAWVAGVDGVMRHWDGVGWSRTANIGSSPSGLTALSGLLEIGPDEVVGVSTLNLAYRYRGQAFGMLAPLGANPFDAPQNLAVWKTGANEYVGNVKGEIWQFDGTGWSLSFTTPGNAKVNDLWGTAANDIWAVADDGTAYHYDGLAWSGFAVALLPLVRVWTHEGGDVWVFGAAGAYHKNGSTWDYTPFAAGTVESVSGSAPDNVWAVQQVPSSVWHFDGTSWTAVQTGASFPPLAVAAVGVDDIHITAEQGRFEHWDGTAWTENALPVLDDLRYIAYTAADDVVAASSRDLVHYNGSSWSTMRTPVDFVPNTADYLPIVDLAVSPGRIDTLQDKYRIRTLIRTRPLICRQRETCGDAVDNDCDNLLDSRDTTECP